LHPGNALALHADHAGRRLGQVDDTAGHIRPAVVDADVDRLAVAEMRDAHLGSERQRLVGCGHGVRVEPATGGHALRLPVERGNPLQYGADRIGAPAALGRDFALGPAGRIALLALAVGVVLLALAAHVVLALAVLGRPHRAAL